MFTSEGARNHKERGESTDAIRLDLSWDEVKTQLASRWPLLNGHDLRALGTEFEAFTSGNYQLLVGRLREHYGLSQSDAEEQVGQFVRSLATRGALEHSSPKVGYGRSRSAR